MRNANLISAIQQAQVSDQWRSLTVSGDLNEQELHALGMKIADMLGYAPVTAEIRWSHLIRSAIVNHPAAFVHGCLCRQVASYIDSHDAYFITKTQSAELWGDYFGHRHEDVAHCPVSWKRALTLDCDFDRFVTYAGTFSEIGSLDDPVVGEEYQEDKVLLLYRFVRFLMSWSQLPRLDTSAAYDWGLYFKLRDWVDSSSTTPTFREYAIQFLSYYMDYARQ